MAHTVDHCDKPAPSRLELYVEGLLAGPELPMFSRQLLELLALSIEEPRAARKLVELVGEDYGLTCKVLQIANSFRYNRSNRPIENVSHAIVVLGAETVQNMASTLVCFQSSKRGSAGLQQLMIRSMVSAHVSAITADELGGDDREVVYLSGMLQNLGEVLVAHHSPARHVAIEARVQVGCSRDAASLSELGFTFDELARAVSRRWNLSERVCSIWDPKTASKDLTALARFGNELTRVMCVDTAAPRNAGVALLLMRYGLSLRLTGDLVAEVWERALGDTRAMFDSLGVSMGPLSLPTVSHVPLGGGTLDARHPRAAI